MHFRSRVQKYVSGEIAVLSAVLLLAAFFRFFRLDAIPPGLNNDEAFNLLDILDTLRGQFSIFFPANTGREPLWFYLNTATLAFFGVNAFALRVTAALTGTITVGLVYGLARTLFSSKVTSALAAFFLAISTWHLFPSRYGLRIILAAMLVLLAVWWFWRGLVSPTHRRFFVMAGICTALALYAHTSSRLLPFLLIALTAFALLFDRKNIRDYVLGLMIAGFVAVLVFIPLGIYFVAHPDNFSEHTANLSIFDPRVNQGNIPQALWNNTVLVLGSFIWRGDHEAYRAVPYRPVFDPFLGAFFIIGIAVLFKSLILPRSSFASRMRAFTIVAWLGVWMLSTLISDDAPNFLRMLPGVSAAMLIAAWGASEIWNRLRGENVQHVAVTVFAALMVVSTLSAFRDYMDFGQSGVAYLGFDGHVADAADWVDQHSSQSQVYMAPLWSIQGTMRVKTRNIPIKAYESRDTVVLPSRDAGQDALVIYPWEQEKKAQTLTQRLGDLGVRENITGTFGFPVAIAVRVPVQNLPTLETPLAVLSRGGEFIQPQKIVNARFNDSFKLFGYSLNATDPAKRNLEVTLFFQSLAPMNEDYTFSVKARDAKDRTWGQEDKWAGNNSYATTLWSPGDVIIEKFYPGLNACAPAGEYRITVEAYNPQTSAVLGLIDLGTTRADASPGNLYEHLEPAETIDLQVAPQTRLLGYTLTPDDVRPGEQFSLALFWRGVADGKQTRSAIIKLRDSSERDFTLVEKTITLAVEGRGLCSYFDLQMPQNAAPGQGAIFVNDAKLSTLNVVR